MPAYLNVDEVAPSSQFGNTGPEGWGFHLWSRLIDDEAPHRTLVERFMTAHPQFSVKLPPYDRYEDFVESYATWDSKPVWVYYETILSHLWLWSPDRDVINDIRSALMPLVDV